jgi:hypothetical protein
MGTIKDISTQAGRQSPNTGILYRLPSQTAQGNDPPSYIGVIRVTQAGLYWVTIWPRTLNGKQVVELRFNPKT